MREKVIDWIERHVVAKREPDVYIGGKVNTYVRRWHLIPRNPLFNVYYHHFLRSDFAEALHDHPWFFNASWLLEGNYTEHSFTAPVDRKSRFVGYEYAFDDPDAGLRDILRPLPKQKQDRVEAGRFKWRWGKSPHRIELDNMGFVVQDDSIYELPVKTLFITGPKIPIISQWGFYCLRGWKHWEEFLAHYGSAHEGLDNKGCD